MKIGFIGLGIMGRPMAKNLIAAGYEVVVSAQSGAKDEMIQAGATTADSAVAVAAASEVVITMLPNSPEVLEVATGAEGVLAGAKPGTILIDMSSIAPAASIQVGEAAKEKGVYFLDAPVSGGEPKAIDGTLAIMVGGEQEVFDQVAAIFEVLGSSATLVGGIGAGNTVKLANQIIVALNIAAVSEALTLAAKAGVDPAVVVDAIRSGLAGSTVIDAKAPMMLAQDFTPGFRIDLHIKDLQNALDTAHAEGSPVPLTAGVMEMLQALRTAGDGGLDHSAIARYYQRLSDIEL